MFGTSMYGVHLSPGAATLQTTFHPSGLGVMAAGSPASPQTTVLGAPAPSPAAAAAAANEGEATLARLRVEKCWRLRNCNLPYNPVCAVLDLQRPGPMDPSSKVQIADVPRWNSGGLSNKQFINAVKAQGANEALQALTGQAYTALTKDVGTAQAIVSRMEPDGTQGHQNWLVFPYDKQVPATGAMTIAPAAAFGSGF